MEPKTKLGNLIYIFRMNGSLKDKIFYILMYSLMRS